MGCGGSTLPLDSPNNGQSGDLKSVQGPLKGPLKGPGAVIESPGIPEYDDPFAFFAPSQKLFDNSKDHARDRNGGFLSLMEGLASNCKKVASSSTCSTPGQVLTAAEKTPAAPENAKVTDSQIDFFKMLDERIEMGPDDESFTDSYGRVFTRSSSAVEGGPYKRWSGPKGPHPTTSPDENNKPTFVNARTGRSLSMKTPSSEDLAEEEEGVGDGSGCGINRDTSKDDDSSVTTEDWSPSIIPNEPVKEQYMFLGNLYTLTRPRMHTPDSHAMIAVTSSSGTTTTHEDTYIENGNENVRIVENGSGGNNTKHEKTLGSHGSDDDDFWDDLEGSVKSTTTTVVSENPKARRRVSLPSDIVRPGILPLRTVLE